MTAIGLRSASALTSLVARVSLPILEHHTPEVPSGHDDARRQANTSFARRRGCRANRCDSRRWNRKRSHSRSGKSGARGGGAVPAPDRICGVRSEEHTSELQSPCNLVCRLLLEKKKEDHCHHSQVLC